MEELLLLLRKSLKFLRKRQLAKFTCKSERCNLNTSSTIAEAGLNLSSSAFSFTNFTILAALTAPGSDYRPALIIELAATGTGV